MEKRPFGNTDMQVTLLGFGGAEIGYEGADQETVNALLNSALDAGLNTIDTAECYMNSEELIGNAVAGRRDDFNLFTKCGHPNPGEENWTKESLLESIRRSLKRLQTDRVDLVQLHSCGLEHLKRGEVIEALQEARAKGYTRYIGYSGDGEAARYAIECGAFDALQTSLSIADQEAIDLTMPLAIKHNMGVVVKRPLANVAWRHDAPPEEEYHVPYWERFQKLQYPLQALPLDEAVAIAMRFTASIPGVSTMIVGTTKPGRWSDNASIIAQGNLPAEEFYILRNHWNEVKGDDWVGLQ